MEGKWLLCMLLVLGTALVQAHDGHDDDVIDIEDDLDDVIEEVEDSKPKPDASSPPSPKVWHDLWICLFCLLRWSKDEGTFWILTKGKAKFAKILIALPVNLCYIVPKINYMGWIWGPVMQVWKQTKRIDPTENILILNSFLCLTQVTYKAPVPTGEVYFADSFDRGTLSG